MQKKHYKTLRIDKATHSTLKRIAKAKGITIIAVLREFFSIENEWKPVK